MNSTGRNLADYFAFLVASQNEQRKLEEKYLTPIDRDLLRTDENRVANYAASGGTIGTGLGILMVSKLRLKRTLLYKAFRDQEKAVVVIFADGRTGKW